MKRTFRNVPLQLKVQDVSVFADIQGDMREGDDMTPRSPRTLYSSLPPMEPTLPPKPCKRSLRMKSARSIMTSASSSRFVENIHEISSVVSPTRPVSSGWKGTMNGGGIGGGVPCCSGLKGIRGPLHSIHYQFPSIDSKSYACLWPVSLHNNSNAAPYNHLSPKGYFLRITFSSNNEQNILLEVVDMYCGATYVGVTTLSQIGVSPERREEYMQLVSECLDSFDLTESCIQITKAADAKVCQRMTVKLSLNLGGWGSVHVLHSSEEYGVDTTLFTMSATPHLVSLMSSTHSNTSHSLKEQRDTLIALRHTIDSLQEKLKT
eukprot:PhF_6_TR31822/c0_g1_i2/m.47023